MYLCASTNYSRNITDSIAAGVHAGIKIVSAGSSFAGMQSAAAGGYGLQTLIHIVRTVGVVTVAVGVVGIGTLVWLRSSTS